MDINFFIDESTPGWQAITCNIPYPGKNHDGWAYKNGNAVVSDGATPLLKEWPDDLHAWVNTLSNLMCEYSVDRQTNILDAWAAAVSFNNNLFTPEGFKRTMGAGHVRLNVETIECAVLGDVKIFVQHTNSDCGELFDERLSRLEEIGDALIDNGTITPEEAAWRNRMKVNTPEGYYVLSDDPTVASKALTLNLDKEGVKSVLIATDGFWRLFKTPLDAFMATDTDDVVDMHQNLTVAGKISDDLTFMRLNKTF